MHNEMFASENLVYRPLRADDLDKIHAFANEPSCRRWFYFLEPDCLTREFAVEKIARNSEAWSRKIDLLRDDCTLGITLKDTGELIGTIGIAKFHDTEELDDLEIGYQVSEAYQGKGYCTEAAKATVAWGFARQREIGMEPKLVGKVEPENWASRKVLENAGFWHIRDERYVKVYEIRPQP